MSNEKAARGGLFLLVLLLPGVGLRLADFFPAFLGAIVLALFGVSPLVAAVPVVPPALSCARTGATGGRRTKARRQRRESVTHRIDLHFLRVFYRRASTNRAASVRCQDQMSWVSVFSARVTVPA